MTYERLVDKLQQINKGVIVVGVDGSGKTTLIDKLSKDLKLTICNPTSNMNIYYPHNGMIFDYDKRVISKNHIWDRCASLDCNVYSPLFTKEFDFKLQSKQLNSFEFKKWMKKLNNNFVFVVVEANYDVIKSRLLERGDKYLNLIIPKINDIKSNYHNFLNNHKILKDVIWYENN